MNFSTARLAALFLTSVCFLFTTHAGAALPVPAPWTPVSVKGTSVACWGREHRVEGALPRQIVSQGKPLLTGPIAFHIDRKTTPVWKPGPLSRTERSAEWTSTGRRGQALIHSRTRIEYDGFWDVVVDLGSGTFRSLSLEIPLASRYARYLHFVNETHYQEPNTLRLPERRGELWADRFACMVWLGDDHVGLAWCADTDAPFRLALPNRALTIHRTGSTATLRITLIDHPVTLREPLTWRFGLIATPVRPLPAGWRDWRLGPGATANHQILWWNAWTGSHADLTPKNPAALRKLATQSRAGGQHLLPYTALQALSERSPDYASRGQEWRREPFSRLEDEGTPYWIMCPHTPWAEYFSRQVERLCREYGVNGLYYDWTFPYRCQAATHPCGYRDAAGARRGEFHVFALRKLAQAAYERVKAVNPDVHILMHTSGALMYPYIGFADMMLNGEQLRQSLTRKSAHYADLLPLDVLRAEYRGEQAGLAPFVIPEFARPGGLPDPERTRIPGPTNELLALLLLHDIGIWPIYCHLGAVEAVRTAQREFGTADARFVPYWEEPDTRSETILASAWVKRGGVLLVVVNRGDTLRRTSLRLRSPLVPAPAFRAADALTGAAVPVLGKAMAVEVPPRSFRLLRLWTGRANRHSRMQSSRRPAAPDLAVRPSAGEAPVRARPLPGSAIVAGSSHTASGTRGLTSTSPAASPRPPVFAARSGRDRSPAGRDDTPIGRPAHSTRSRRQFG